MPRKRITEVFPFLLPLRKWQRKKLFYLKMQMDGSRYAKALGCSGFARVDMFLTPSGEIVFNEVNTIPGFTSHSRYPNMMKGIGLSFAEMLDKLIGLYVE